MKIRYFVFNKAYWIDCLLVMGVMVYIASFLAQSDIITQLNKVMPPDSVKILEWAFIAVFATVIFAYIKKRDIVKSDIRAHTLKCGDALTVKIGKNVIKGEVLQFASKETKNLCLDDYTDITKRIRRFKKIPFSKQVIIDVGDKKYLRISLADNINLI